MTTRAAPAESRAVTMYVSSEVYGCLVEDALKLRRTPGDRAAELFTAALSVTLGERGERLLEDVVTRLNARAKASTSKPRPEPEPSAAPSLLPEPPPAPGPKPLTHWEAAVAALTPRAAALRLRYALTPTEAALFDVLVGCPECQTPAQLQLALPEELRPSTEDSLTVAVARLRKKTTLSYEDLQNIRGVGYRLSQDCTARILADVEPLAGQPA